jgi:hypothetical protein
MADIVLNWFMEDKTVFDGTEKETAELLAKFSAEKTKDKVCEHCFQSVRMPVTRRDKDQLTYLNWLYKMAYCQGC